MSPRPRPLLDSVLRLIWKEKEISRAEIARRAELSRSTVSEIVTLLLQTGLVAEVGAGPSRGGRRPIVLRFQDDAACILGVEMGAAHVGVVRINLRGELLAWERVDQDVRNDPEGTRALILKLCLDVLGSDPAPLVGIGIAVPSPVDPKRPGALSEVVLPRWEGRNGLLDLLAPLGAPVLVDNDANLGALAEQWWGCAVGEENFAYVKIATGIGSGHVINGEIYRGATGVAGEIGHVAIDPVGGDPCICGLRGCLTTIVGSPALVKRARALLEQYPDSLLADGEITMESIEKAALESDPAALLLLRDATDSLGTAIAGMLNLMNPSLVVLGGGLSSLGETLLAPLRDAVSWRTHLSSVAAAEIRTSDLGPRSVAVGAATLVLKSALADSSLFPESAGSIASQ
ncbi:MAG: ROK family transcriptional regulator [Gemmatimonadetes bacterium]|nr:ROK family transcriptional regulator [Gemmatimonadota bacterium]